MIVFNVGTPGSGKSYDAILKIIANLRKRRMVCTNIDGMDKPECQEYLKNLVGMDDFEFTNHFRWLTKDEVMKFWKTEPVKRVLYSGDSTVAPIEEIREELICPIGSLIIIDEVHKYYNARDWQASASRELGDWASTHRHFGYDLVLITQSIDKVDKQVRTLTEWTYFFRKVNFLGSMVSKKYIKYSYSGDDHDGKALAKNVGTYEPSVFPCYSSYSAADAKEVGFMSHVNILKHPVFFAIPVVICLCLYMFSKSSFATGDILGANAIQKRNAALALKLNAAPARAVGVPAVVNPVVAPALMGQVSSARVAPIWPVANALNSPLPDYVRYPVNGYIDLGNGRYIVSINGVSVHLPNADVQKFYKNSRSVLARSAVFGEIVQKNIYTVPAAAVPVVAPVPSSAPAAVSAASPSVVPSLGSSAYSPTNFTAPPEYKPRGNI